MAFKAGPERGSRSAENVFFTIKKRPTWGHWQESSHTHMRLITAL